MGGGGKHCIQMRPLCSKQDLVTVSSAPRISGPGQALECHAEVHLSAPFKGHRPQKWMHIQTEQFESLYLGVYMYTHAHTSELQEKNLKAYPTIRHTRHVFRWKPGCSACHLHTLSTVPWDLSSETALLTWTASASTAHVRAGCRRFQRTCELREINTRIPISDGGKNGGSSHSRGRQWRQELCHQVSRRGSCFSVVAVKARAQMFLGWRLETQGVFFWLRISHRTVLLRRQEGTEARSVLVYGAEVTTMAMDGPVVLSCPAGLTLWNRLASKVPWWGLEGTVHFSAPLPTYNQVLLGFLIEPNQKCWQ